MKKFHSILASLLLITLFSCEETITLDLDQTKPAIVIEGLVTNRPGKQYIKISRTAEFYKEGATEKITTATVMVADDKGKAILFLHNPANESGQDGYYFPSETFIGEIGRTYTLSVTVDGKSYEAQDELLPVTTIDSLSSRINKKQQDNPKAPNQIYELLGYMKEPQETKDYYLFKYYRNDTINIFNKSSDIYFSDDVGVGENIDGIASPVYFEAGDNARFELYSLSRNAFYFYSDLSNLLNNDGGMISPPPTNPRSNLSNGALGFFGTSAVSSATRIITKQ
jgi:hypothetical protein